MDPLGFTSPVKIFVRGLVSFEIALVWTRRNHQADQEPREPNTPFLRLEKQLTQGSTYTTIMEIAP